MNIFHSEKEIQIFDLETLSTRPTAGIIQIGACRVNIKERSIVDELLININKRDSIEYKFHIDKKTVEWWKAQDQAVKDSLNVDLQPMECALHKFEEWLRKDQYLASWGIFDHTVMANAFNVVYNKDVPWDHRKIFDMRLLKLMTGYEFVENDMQHNALADCKSYANMLIDIFSEN